MAGPRVSRHVAYLVLAAVMAVGLAVAVLAGIVAIVRFGEPASATATVIAETFAWIFAAALLIAFACAVSDELEARRSHT